MGDKRDIRKSLKELQNLVGAKPKIEVSKFQNWASTQVRNEILSVSPTSVAEVQAVVRAARQLGLRVRAAGRTHSWTPLFSDEGDIVMHVRQLDRPDGPRLELTQDPDDPNSKMVTMATGVTTGEFRDFQLETGYCIPANVILRIVQMGGVVVPACHGVGWDVKTVSDDLVKMRIVDSNGELREYSLNEDEDMMHAVQANMGLWGIIVDLTLKVSPMIIVETDNVWIQLKDIFYDKDKLQKIVTDNWSVEIFWFPFNGISAWESVEAFMEGEIDLGEWDPKDDDVWIRVINKSDKVGETEDQHFYDQMDFISFLQSKGFQFVDSFIANCPQCAPSFLRTQVQQLKKNFSGRHIQQLPHAVHFRDYIQDVPVYDMEWAIPLDNDFSNIMKSIHHVVELVHKDALAGRFPMNLPLEMRFIADSDVYLAPCGAANPKYGGSGHTCMIEVLTVANTPGWEGFCQKVADVWQTNPGARPHWCKEWSFLKDIDGFLKKGYSDVMPKFIGALERSGADPDGIFFNNRLENIFYPQGHSGWSKLQVEQNNNVTSKTGPQSGAKGGEDNAKGGSESKKSSLCRIL